MASGGYRPNKSGKSEPKRRSNWQQSVSSDRDDAQSLNSLHSDMRINNWDLSDLFPSNLSGDSKRRKKSKGNPEREREQSLSLDSPPHDKKHYKTSKYPHTRITPSSLSSQRVALENLKQHMTFSDLDDNSDWQALETLMTFHSADLGSHRLAILSNFPETTDPAEYKSLLPEISDDGDVLPWETDSWREPDWSEAPVCRRVVDLSSEDEAQFLYTNFDNKYRREKLNRDLVQEWYFTRVCEIERKARLVDSAIELVKLAMERGAENLSELLDDLMVMDMMVYECGVQDSLTFSTLREMADYDRLEYIMSKSSEEMYSKNLRRWMVPFLQQCEQKEPMAYSRLLRDYVLTKARSDLTLVLKIFEASKPNVRSPIIQTQTELMSLVLDSLYSCERSDQLDLANKICECLPIWSHDSSKESPEILRLHKQVDLLELHISAAKIFLAYGINKTLVSIKESENNAEEAKSLMIKLTRQAGRRNVPLSELEWHKLHEDVLSLQSKVYHCISPSVCLEIFVQSLMCSERQETIHLAGQMLERSVESKPNHLSKGAGKFKVPHARAVELVLSAAKEYFDSSANLSDPCMDLARSCLNLILDAPQPIQEELDLIASLALLDEFGAAVLPLQVRLSNNRLELVKKAVTTKPTSYKQTQRLLRLGQLLAIPCKNNDERDGVILLMSAEAAVAALDYEFAYQCCERLISLCHSPAWSVCVQLAEQEGFQNIHAKSKLLSFALTYCSKEMIQPVLQTRCLLETRILYDEINKILNVDKVSDATTSRESPFSARAAIKQTQQILSSTKKTTSAVLSTVTDTKWWQGAITSLKHPQHDRGDNNIGKGKDDNSSFRKQGCHPFYAGFIEDCYEDLSVADYWGVADGSSNSDSVLSAHLLRTAQLEDMLTKGEKQHLAVEALMDLAKKTMARDTTLGLAYLLAIPKGFNVDSCFESFPSTDISLQVAVYFYSLQIYSSMQSFTPTHVYALYRQTPAKVIGRVLDYIASSSELEWSGEVQALVKKLQMYQEMLEDYSQACTLKRLGKGVDVMRFAEDNDYKRETILGLAMSLDDEVYNISLSLAKRYDLPLWDVYMCHLEYLFYDSGLSIEDLQSRVSKLDILSTLNERSSEFTERMMTRIYPTLVGTDLRALTYFFSLLDAVQGKILCGLSPSEHAALLKKLKPACPGLDYKKLMAKKTSTLDVLRPCLTASNINTLAKLAPQIPEKEGSFLQPSALYSCWASQVFWGRDGNKKSLENMAGWVHRYEAIGDWIQKLRPEDLLDLIDNIVFTPEAREKLDISCRTEISKRALKFSRQSGTGKKKKLDESGRISWEECSSHLQTRLSHLMSLTNDTIQSFAQATDPTFSSYAQKYDLSKGDLQIVELLLVQMILDGQAVELVEDILQVAPPSSLKTRTIVRSAVSLIVKALRGEDFVHGIKASKPWLDMLQMVVENVRKHQDNGGDLVEAENVMSLLRSFCSDASIEVPPRLNVLKVLEKSFDLSDTDKTLLTLYRTGALVSSTWPEIEVTEHNIVLEESRFDLFRSLLDKCVTKDHFLSLSRILVLWPQFSQNYSNVTDKHPWVQIFTAVLKSQGKHGGEIINQVLRNECPEFPLDDKSTEHMFEVLLQHHQPVCAVKLILQSSHGKLLDKGLSVLTSLTEGIDDEDLLRLILSNKLSPQVVSMPVYLHLATYILNCQGQPDCPEYLSALDVASQLYKAGAKAEAGSLLLQARSSHSLLQTFNSALTSLSHWFSKS